MNAWPRVAFFTDSFHGVDGVATTSRNIVEAARRRGLPLLSIHVGDRTRHWRDGSIEFLELEQGPISFSVDRHLRFDLLFVRHFSHALSVVRDFRAEVVHITSPGDVGITGARAAAALQFPLVASWHTNVHEFAAQRLKKVASVLPEPQRKALADCAQENVLRACVCFYQMAQVLLAPNQECLHMLTSRTGKTGFLMGRGVDTHLFSAKKRDIHDNVFRLGFVGRLRPEKNLRLLADLEKALRSDGVTNYRFLIVGEGSERQWLERKLIQADFTGELYGELLARAYANMDLFVFPSQTDTYGNVVNEALASGTPSVVTCKGGPKYQVQNGVTGFVTTDEADFIAKVKLLVTNPKVYASLRKDTLSWTGAKSWDHVLGELHEAYQASLSTYRIPGNSLPARWHPSAGHLGRSV